MTLVELLLLLLVAGVCGGVARQLAGGARGGCLVSVVLGFVGAYLGGLVSRKFDLPEPLRLSFGETTFPVMWSIIGAALFVAVLTLIAGKKRL